MRIQISIISDLQPPGYGCGRFGTAAHPIIRQVNSGNINVARNNRDRVAIDGFNFAVGSSNRPGFISGEPQRIFRRMIERHYDPATAERRIYRMWEEADAFSAGANSLPGADPYCIMIPPPNVTGVLHMGHAFNNTIQDILIRWRRMQGRDVLWQPGQDHAGIATQMVVERSMADGGELSRREIGREKFLEKVWEWKGQSGGAIISQLKRLGASCDWSRNRFTMDSGFHDAVLEVFVRLYDKGIIFRGKRLVNWDPHFETAISDIEVEQVEIEGKLWRLRYPLENGESYRHPIAFNDAGEAVAWEDRDHLVVATTRPETMLGDTGVAVNPADERYLHLIGKTVRLPLSGRSIPIVADRHADPEKGTGAVKITPAHDFNDWEVGLRTGLRAINVMSPRAEMALENNPDFLEGCDASDEAMALHGLDRYEARERIVQLAREQGWLDGVSDDRHAVPHGDRSKVAIEPYLTDQWFVDAGQIVEPAIDAIREGKTRIHPEQYENLYLSWLRDIKPWCISRQLWWGHQVPVWYDVEGNAYCAPTEDEAIARSGGRALTRDPDVLDTWFSSGIWPIGTLGWPEETPELKRYFPTDVLVTGFDIIFFWVARMMMMQLAIVDQVPFHTVYVHALVRDEQGRKMSKSLGNVIDPIELIDKYGADAVRFTLAAMAAMGRDLRLSENRVAGYRNFGTKLWNAARFARVNQCRHGSDFEPNSVSGTVNRWIVAEVGYVQEAVDAALEACRFNDAAEALYGFVWGSVCDWYLEFAKELLNSEDGEVIAETRQNVSWVIDQCLILLHPFMPFITEEIWGHSERSNMLVHERWPRYRLQDPIDQDPVRDTKLVIRLIEEIRSARALMRVPAAARIGMLELDLNDDLRAAVDGHTGLIARLGRIDSFGRADKAPSGSATISIEGGVFCLLLDQVVDVEAESSRLATSLSKIRNEADAVRKRLANPGFINRAPESVVEENRTRLVNFETKEKVFAQALERLKTGG